MKLLTPLSFKMLEHDWAGHGIPNRNRFPIEHLPQARRETEQEEVGVHLLLLDSRGVFCCALLVCFSVKNNLKLVFAHFLS